MKKPQTRTGFASLRRISPLVLSLWVALAVFTCKSRDAGLEHHKTPDGGNGALTDAGVAEAEKTSPMDLSRWIPLLHAGTCKERVEVIRDMAGMGEDASPASLALARLLNDEKCNKYKGGRSRSTVSFEAEKALLAIGPEAISSLSVCLDRPYRLSSDCEEAFGSFGLKVVPFLLDSLADEKPSRRQRAAEMLGEMTVDSPEVIQGLTSMFMKDKDEEARQDAAIALSGMGTSASDVIPELTRRCRTGDYSYLMALGKFGSVATSAVHPLIGYLEEDPDACEGELVETLGEIGPTAKDAIPYLADAAAKDRRGIFGDPSVALGEIGYLNREARRALRIALRHKDYTARQNAAAALREFGVDAFVEYGALRKSINDPYEDIGYAPVRKESAWALASVALVDPRAITTLSRSAFDGKKGNPYALGALDKLGLRAADTVKQFLLFKVWDAKQWDHDHSEYEIANIGKYALPDLVQLIGDKKLGRYAVSSLVGLEEVGARAAPFLVTQFEKDLTNGLETHHLEWAVTRMGSSALPPLREALDRAPPETRGAIEELTRSIDARVQEESNPPRPRPVAELVEILRDGSCREKIAAALELNRHGPNAASAADQLVDAIRDPVCNRLICVHTEPEGWPLKDRAAQALSSIGEPALRSLLLKDRFVGGKIGRNAGYDALVGIGAPAVHGLMERLDFPAYEERLLAIEFLGRIGEAAAPSAAKLLPHLDSSDDEFRMVAAKALGSIGPSAEEALPRVVTMAVEAPTKERIVAIGALGSIGMDHPDALSAVTASLDDELLSIQLSGLKAIVASGERAKGARDVLIGRLAKRGSRFRPEVIEALAAMGPEDEKIAEALLEATRDGDWVVRVLALEGLSKISRPSREVLDRMSGCLSDKSVHVRIAAAEGLGKAGSAAHDAEKQLRTMESRDKYLWARYVAGHSLLLIAEPKPAAAD